MFESTNVTLPPFFLPEQQLCEVPWLKDASELQDHLIQPEFWPFKKNLPGNSVHDTPVAR